VFSRAGSPFWAGTLGDFNQTCQHVPILPTGNNTVTLTQDEHGNPVTYPPKDPQRPLDAYLGNCDEAAFYCDPTSNTCLKQKSTGEACESTNQCEGKSVCYSSVCTDLSHNGGGGTSLSLASRVSVGMLAALVVLTFISLVVLIFCKPKQRGKDVEDVGENSQEIEMLYFARAPAGNAPAGNGNTTSSPQAATTTEEAPTVTTVTVTTSTVSTTTPAQPVPEIVLSRPDTPDSEDGGRTVEHELTRTSGTELPSMDVSIVDDSYLVEEPPPPYIA